MTTKTINGTYSAGYTLSSGVGVLSITSSGVIGGTGLTASTVASIINYGVIEAGTAGASGATLAGGSVLNGATGLIFGGRGKNGAGVHSGYAGGAGIGTTKSESITNSGALAGGQGGTGGAGANGLGGSGGTGVVLGAGGSIVSTGLVYGGQGGTGGVGTTSAGGAGGAGGAAVSLTAGGSVTNSYLIAGGQGGTGGAGGAGFSGGAGGAGGTGVAALSGGSIVNSYEILGGGGGLGGSGSVAGANGATGTGVVLGGGGMVTNGALGNTGALIAGGIGVSVSGAGATVINFGTIEGYGGTAVSLASGDTLVAESGSTFIGALSGGGGTLKLLAGSLEGEVDGLSGFGSVSFAAGGLWEFDGSNTIAGGLGVAGGTVGLGGTISNGGGGTAAVDFVSGTDRLVVETGAVIAGGVVGDGAASTLELSGGTGTIAGLGAGGGVLSGSASGSFSGFGSYQVDAGGSWTLSGNGTLTSGQTLTAYSMVSVAGELNNSSLIVGGVGVRGTSPGAGATAIYIGPGTLMNGGKISGGLGGAGAGVDGYAYGGGRGGYGLALTGSGTVVNSGLVTGGAGGAGAGGVNYFFGAGGGGAGAGALVAAGTLSNTGTIAGGLGGAGAYGTYGGGPGGSGGVGVDVDGGAMTNAGRIVGGVGGAGGGAKTFEAYGGSGGYGAALSGGVLTNTGTIVGGQGGQGAGGGGYGGSGGAGAAGAEVKGGAQLVNSGLVSGGAGGSGGVGAQGTGLSGLDGAGIVIEGAGSLINTGTASGAAGGSGAPGDGVDLVGAGGVATNRAGALMKGEVGISALSASAATIINYGTVRGTTYSVVLGTTSDTLVVGAGAAFVGAVEGGGGEFDIASGSETISAMGASEAILTGSVAATISAFGIYAVEGGAQLLLNGTGTLGSTGEIFDAGAVEVAGTLSNSGIVQGGAAASGAVGATALTISSRGDLINQSGGRVQGGLGGVGSTHRVQGGVGGAGGIALVLGGTLNNVAGTIAGGVGGDGGRGNSGGAGGVGGVGIDAAASALATSGAYILGGEGGVGGVGHSHGGAGGSGGVGLLLTSASTAGAISGIGAVTGGMGGQGGYSATLGGSGGAGGAGIVLLGGSTFSNKGSTIVGGVGGSGGAGSPSGHGGAGGRGGDGLDLTNGGSFTNAGKIIGGNGGAGGSGGVSGGAGLQGVGVMLSAGGTITNGSAAQPTADIVGLTGLYASGTAASVVVNWATISGTKYSVLFGGSADHLYVEAGSDFIGRVAGGGGGLNLVGLSGTISGLGSIGTLSQGAHATFSGFGDYDFGPNTAITLSGSNELNSGQTWSDYGTVLSAGTLGLAAGSTTTIGNSGTIELTGTGSISGSVSGGSLVVAGASLNVVGGAVLSMSTFAQSGSASAVTINQDAAFTGDWMMSAGSLTMATGDSFTISGHANNIDGTIGGGGDLSISGGTTTIGAGAAFAVAAWSITGVSTNVDLATNLNYAGGFSLTANASLNVGSGETLNLTGPSTIEAALTGPGTVDFGGQSLTLAGGANLSAAQTVLTVSTVSASGLITLTGALAITSSDLTISSAGLTLTGGGLVAFSDLATNTVNAAAGAVLVNAANTITGAGKIGTGGNLTLDNRVGAVIDGTGTNALVINTGANTVTNLGLIEATGAGGLTIESAITNGGTLEANGGVLTVDGAVTGIGAAVINGGVLYLASSFSQNVTFQTGATGVLKLAQSQSYKGTVTGLSHTGANWFDLLDIGFKSAKEATFTSNGNKTGGTLTVTDGTHTATITLVGDYAGATWTCSSDGHGGTIVKDPTAPDAMAVVPSAPPPMGNLPVSGSAQQQGFVAAMAALNPPAAASTGSDVRSPDYHTVGLAKPVA